jgi:energy-converting hydrogenase Eha subunit E
MARMLHPASVETFSLQENMFLFFSNRLGCLGSIAVSAVLTLVLLLLFGVI